MFSAPVICKLKGVASTVDVWKLRIITK